MYTLFHRYTNITAFCEGKMEERRKKVGYVAASSFFCMALNVKNKQPMNLKYRLSALQFLQFAIWGTYLTSMGAFLSHVGMGAHIGLFFSVQGVVSLFMPALMGIIADRWVEAQRLFSFCHLMSGLFLLATCAYGYSAGNEVQFGTLFALYVCNVLFFMPSLALSYSVSYSALEREGLDTVKIFPIIRTWGTVGFICSMWVVDLCQWQTSALQFGCGGVLALIMAAYSLTLPRCEIKACKSRSLIDALGLRAFALLRDYRMFIFFLFAFLIGVCGHITNAFANPFIRSFGRIAQYADTFGVNHTNILISLSQMSETLCFLLIPFCLRRFGIKRVILLSMLAWVLRFAFFAWGNPGDGLWLFILSMLVYGIAFDFFNISGSIYVNKETDPAIRSSAQGLFLMMTNGFGSMFGTPAAQYVINRVVTNLPSGASGEMEMERWGTAWLIFAGYALAVAILFWILFPYKPIKEK